MSKWKGAIIDNYKTEFKEQLREKEELNRRILENLSKVDLGDENEL